MVFTYNTLSELVSHLSGVIRPNGNKEISGQVHQDALLTIANSLVAIISNVPPSTVNQFPPYVADTVYTGGREVVVRHSNKLWLFVHASDQIGVTPGSNGLVWQELSAAQLAHFRNQDQMLDQGGPNEVTAAQLRALLNAPGPSTTWKRAFDELDVTPPVSPLSDVTYLVDVGANGAWSGHDLSLARYVSGAWLFEQMVDGDVTRYTQGGYVAFITFGSIVLYDLDQLGTGSDPDDLQSVLVNGRTTGPYRPILERGFHLPNSIEYVTGLVVIDPSVASAWRFVTMGEVVLQSIFGAANGVYFIRIDGAVGGPFAFSLGSGFVVPAGIAVPEELYPYDHYLITCIGSMTGVEGDGSNLVVTSVHKI